MVSNLAAVHMAKKDFFTALHYAQQGLRTDSSHIKCLYNCRVANRHLGNYKTAVEYLDTAHGLVRKLFFAVNAAQVQEVAYVMHATSKKHSKQSKSSIFTLFQHNLICGICYFTLPSLLSLSNMQCKMQADYKM